jgi:hypothetical protein
LNTLHVVVRSIVVIQHGACDIRDVLSGITLTSDVHLVALHAKGVDEVLPESVELSSNIGLIVDKGVSGRETSRDWLINPYHVCEVCPGVRVGYWGVSTGLPREGSVFLEETI